MTAPVKDGTQEACVSHSSAHSEVLEADHSSLGSVSKAGSSGILERVSSNLTPVSPSHSLAGISVWLPPDPVAHALPVSCKDTAI